MQFQYKYFLYLIDVGVSNVTVMLILGKQASVMSETISKKKTDYHNSKSNETTKDLKFDKVDSPLGLK